MTTYLAWVGQNSTTGNPHNKTGLLSMHGNLHQFSTLKSRNLFVDEFYSHQNPSLFAVSTNKQKAKTKYFAGMSQHAYNEYLGSLSLNIN